MYSLNVFSPFGGKKFLLYGIFMSDLWRNRVDWLELVKKEINNLRIDFSSFILKILKSHTMVRSFRTLLDS